ncbi:hypothetical protein EMCRGX_G011888 [Ephydatia muelleri]
MLLVLWVLYPFLTSIHGGYLNCSDHSTKESCPQCFCPNTSIKYICKLDHLESTTRWTVPPSLCTQTDGNNWILLPQAAGCGGNKISCGAFVASNAPVNDSTTPCSLSQLELTVTDQMAQARVQCSSIKLNGVSLEQYESSPITIISDRSENFTVMLSNNTTAIVSSGVLSYMFSDLAPDTCYNITIIANSCSGSGLPVSKLHCTTANPPTGVVASIIVQQDTQMPVQLQVVWHGNDGNSGYSNYSVTINGADIDAVSSNYAIWPIAVVPSYFVVSVSSVTQAGKGPSSPNTNISGTILDSNIVNATIIHNTTVSCKFSSLDSHHCLVCCSTDPLVPPDSSVYNISSTNGTDVTVVLTDLVAGHVYYCKVAATADTKANCFSPVYRGIQTLIHIIPGQIPADQIPPVTSADTKQVSISEIAAISVVVVAVFAISIVFILIIIRHAAERKTFCNAKKQFTEDVSLQQSVPAHIYEEVVPKAALSSVQSAGNATPDAVAPYESVQDTAAVDSANQNERVYHTIGQTVKDSVANQMQLDTKHIIIPPHVYAILENRAASNESDNEEEHGKYK